MPSTLAAFDVALLLHAICPPLDHEFSLGRLGRQPPRIALAAEAEPAVCEFGEPHPRAQGRLAGVTRKSSVEWSVVQNQANANSQAEERVQDELAGAQ